MKILDNPQIEAIDFEFGEELTVTRYYFHMQALETPTGKVRYFRWLIGEVYNHELSEKEEQKIIKKAFNCHERTMLRGYYEEIPLRAKFSFPRPKTKNKCYSYDLLDLEGKLKPNYKEIIESRVSAAYCPAKNNDTEEF